MATIDKRKKTDHDTKVKGMRTSGTKNFHGIKATPRGTPNAKAAWDAAEEKAKTQNRGKSANFAKREGLAADAIKNTVSKSNAGKRSGSNLVPIKNKTELVPIKSLNSGVKKKTLRKKY